MEYLKKANSVEPNNLILTIETSATLGQLGKHKEAVTMLEMAVNIHPREPRIQSNLGLSYLIGGEVENAVKAFEVLLLLEPDYAVNRKLLNLVKEIKLGAKPMPKCEADIAKMM